VSAEHSTTVYSAFASLGLPAGNAALAGMAGAEDFLFFQAPLVYEGRNGNGDIFTRSELQLAYQTLIANPLDIDHEFTVKDACGKLFDAEFRVENGVACIWIVGGILADFDHGLLAKKLKHGIITGISMECLFQRGEQTLAGRILHGVKFIGAGLVRTPAESRARIPLDSLSSQPLSFAAQQRRQALITAAANAAARLAVA